MSRKPLKIIADENMPQAERLFSSLGEVTLLPGREIKASDIDGTDILLVRSITQVNQQLLGDNLLRFVGSATIGTDHVDQSFLAERGIPFSNAPGCNAEAVVDYVISSIYLLAEKRGIDPLQQTYGVVGVGNVGGRLVKRLRAMGCKVLLNDPPRAEVEEGFSDLTELVEQCDFISMHTPLIRTGAYPTYHLMNHELLSQLKENTTLLNAGRGPAIDNRALLQVKKQRPDLNLVLDVWEDEPEVDAELAELCQIVSPHIAGYSLEGKVRGSYMLYQALTAQLGEKPAIGFEQCLPAPEVPVIKGRGKLLSQLIHSVYDPSEDDRLLRATLASSQQKRLFDQLRKSYRIRRELGSIIVSAADQPELCQALGFRVEP